MFKLVIQDDEGKTTVVPLIRDEITIGRKEGNTIRLTERNVSRRHARILRANGEVQIEDLGSYNGIRVNNARIAERVNLRVSDQVQIGDYKLYLKAEGVEQVDDARTMPIERVEAGTDVLPAVSPAPTAPIAIPTPGIASPAVANGTGSQAAVQVTGNPNRTLVAMADTDPTTGRPLASPALIAAAIPQQTGFGKLVVLSSNFAGKEYELARPQMIIGRTDENDLVVNHRSISRNHAKVVREPDSGRYTISDLQSSNGVRVNGNDYSKVELRRGDVVDLGHVRLRFVEPGEDFVFSRDAVITDVPETGGKKGLLVAIILGVLVLGGVLVFVLTRGSGDSGGKGDGTGTNGMVHNPKPDAPEVAVNPPPADADQGTVTPPPLDGGGSTTAATDEAKKIKARCTEHANDRKWTDLADCGKELTAAGSPEGAEFVTRGVAEASNEVRAREIEKAIKGDKGDPDLKKAYELLNGITPGSVYLKDANKAYETAKRAIYDSTVADLRAFLRDCKKYESKAKTISDKYGKQIVDEASKKVGRCSDQTAVVTPKTCEPACGEGFVCKGTTCEKKKEVTVVTPPTNPCADQTLTVDTEKKGDEAMASGSYAAALASFEVVFKCKPAVARKAYLAACKARIFPKAKLYFKYAGQDSLSQICLKEGYDPRTAP